MGLHLMKATYLLSNLVGRIALLPNIKMLKLV